MALASSSPLRIGARKSTLARIQADLVAEQLGHHGITSEFVPISTQGDVDPRQLTQIGGTGVFAGAVRQALLDGRIDVGVHSLKDLPTEPVDRLWLIAHPVREDTRDVLVGRRLDELPATHEARIGTGAPRRAAQLAQWARDRGQQITIEPVRGNVETRIELVRSGRLDAVVLAGAGLRRLGLLDAEQNTVAGLPAQLLPHDVLLPAPGQGALAVEVADRLDSEICAVLTRLDDAVTRTEILAERQFLAVLGAGCTAPVGARATVESGCATDTDLTLRAVIGKTRRDGDIQRTRDDIAHHDQQQLAGEGCEYAVADTDASRIDQILDGTDVMRLHGRGTAAAPQDLGHRMASRALAVLEETGQRLDN